MKGDRQSITRRLILKITGGMILMPSFPSSIFDFFVKPLPVRTVEQTRFKFDTGKGFIEWEKKAKEEYRLVVDGMVAEAKRFSYADLRSFAQVKQVSDFHCVEGWSVKDLTWEGFRFKEILDKVAPAREATHVLFHSLGTTGSSPKGQSHYIESLPLAELISPEREILLTLTMDGKPLPEEYGGPLRLIAPYDLGYKSIKFISKIEFIKEPRPGWWTLANPIYAIEARVPKNRLRRLPGK
jgi:DMSO/TMAO reductase YedYZ molybdopterin-dependent catalytic subunit